MIICGPCNRVVCIVGLGNQTRPYYMNYDSLLDDENRVRSRRDRCAHAGRCSRVAHHSSQINVRPAPQGREKVILAVAVLTDCRRPEVVWVECGDKPDLSGAVKKIDGLVVLSVSGISGRDSARCCQVDNYVVVPNLGGEGSNQSVRNAPLERMNLNTARNSAD